jgi:hypothetical protein
LESRRDGSEWWRDGGLRPAVRWNGGVGTSVLLDDGGKVGKLPGDVVELKPGSIWVRRGRKRGFHSEAEAAAAALRR